MSQNTEILEWMKRKPITARDAMVSLQCYRLAARIMELREKGYYIKTEMEEHEGGKHAKYYLLD